jgi:hypothetical protein
VTRPTQDAAERKAKVARDVVLSLDACLGVSRVCRWQLQLQLLHIEPGKKLVIREESKASRCKAAAGFRRGDAPLPVSVADTCSTHPEIKNIACSARPS